MRRIVIILNIVLSLVACAGLMSCSKEIDPKQVDLIANTYFKRMCANQKYNYMWNTAPKVLTGTKQIRWVYIYSTSNRKPPMAIYIMIDIYGRCEASVDEAYDENRLFVVN